jgi:aryl-alcohol dehydrogenase-like predicted oxidoreductase
MKTNDRDPLTRREFIREGTVLTAGLAAGLGALAAREVRAGDAPADVTRTRSYHPGMEYRRLGKTNLWVSAVCMGGHWKRIEKVIGSRTTFGDCENLNSAIPADLEAFHRNRQDVITRCLEVGINCLDFAGAAEPYAYGRALKGRRDKIYLCWSMGAQEMRHPEHRQAKVLVDLLEKGLRETGLEYADVWRVMAHERGSLHTEKEIDEMLKALQTAKQKGLCRFTGISTHDRPWAKMLIEKYPDVLQVLVTPYTANSKTLPQDSLFEAIRQQDVGVFGIKPFASNSLFAGDGSPQSPQAEEDDRRARLAVRYILGNPAITAPIPGLISAHQVDNVVQAVKERRQLDAAENRELEAASQAMWARLPQHYGWLREWEYV